MLFLYPKTIKNNKANWLIVWYIALDIKIVTKRKGNKMIQQSNFDRNGGDRTYYDVEAKVKEITSKRHFKTLWLKKTKKIFLEVKSVPTGTFENAYGKTKKFPEEIVIYDLGEYFLNLSIGEGLSIKIGYANASQQKWQGVNTFSVSILRNGEEIRINSSNF